MRNSQTPTQTRRQDAEFVATCSFAGLQARLPLRWPTPPETPPSPKKHYRSWYTYPGDEKLSVATVWETLPEFELLLFLVDFSGLRPVLAKQLGWRNPRGQVPFDPVSLFLLLGWQLSQGWNRAEVLRKLTQPRYADLTHLFGFRAGQYPTEGGLRYFLTTLGQNSSCPDQPLYEDEAQGEVWLRQQLNDLIAQSVKLFREAGLIGSEVWDKAQICPDHIRLPPIYAAAKSATTAMRPPPLSNPAPVQPRQKANRGVAVTPSPAPALVVSPPPVMLRRDLSFTRGATSLTPALTKPKTRSSRNLAGVASSMVIAPSPCFWLSPVDVSASSSLMIFVPPTSPNPPQWRLCSYNSLTCIPPSTSMSSPVTPPLAPI